MNIDNLLFWIARVTALALAVVLGVVSFSFVLLVCLLVQA